MSPPLLIEHLLAPVRGSIRPPGSKSLTNRAMVLAALAGGESTLTGVLDSQDTRVMRDSLLRLGFQVSGDMANGVLHVQGERGRVPASRAELWLENSGTSIRFVAALCTLGEGTFRLDGSSRMRERPIGPLAAALEQCGAAVSFEGRPECPPLEINCHGWRPGDIDVAGSLSSQFLSALLMAAPAAGRARRIRVLGTLVSRPYVDMTLAVMRQFGADVDEAEPNCFTIRPGRYRAREYAIEPDASAASYFVAAAAVTAGEVAVQGLSRGALQGDVRFVSVLEQMGCTVSWGQDAVTVHGGPLKGVDVDMNDISDTAQTLACVAPFAVGPTRIRNVAHMRHKETDRVHALVTELRRVGLQVEEHDDGLTVFPGPMHPATIETYNDHRMAMSFAVLGLRQPGVSIADPGCTEKTYPEFFRDLGRLCAAARGGAR